MEVRLHLFVAEGFIFLGMTEQYVEHHFSIRSTTVSGTNQLDYYVH